MSSICDFFLMVRGPIVFIRFSKRLVKQKDVKQILYGINRQQKKRAMMSIRFNFSSLRSWREEQIHNELAILYQSLPSSFLTLLCPSLGSRRRTLGTPSPGLPYQTVWLGDAQWRYQQEVKALEKREVDFSLPHFHPGSQISGSHFWR